MLNLTAGILVTAVIVGQADVQKPHDENLEPMRPMIGKWVGHTELDNDIPNVAKKGDAVDFTIIYRWTPTGNAISASVSLDIKDQTVPVVDTFFTWDPSSQKIVAFGTEVGPAISRSEVTRDGKTIVLKGTGATAENEKTSGTVTYTIISRDERTVQLTDRTRGTTAIPDSPIITMKRVKWKKPAAK